MFGCGLNSSVITPVAVSLILVGLVVYYFNIRLKALERTAQKQNQVIASLLGGMRGGLAHQELCAAGMGAQEVAPAEGAEEAARAALCCAPSVGQRIAVSDDDGSGSSGSEEDYDDTSDGSRYSESESEEDEGDADDKQASPSPTPSATGEVRVIDLGADAEDVKAVTIPAAEDEDVQKDAQAAEPAQAKAAEETAKETGQTSDAPGSSLKVKALRALVVEKSLATPAEAKAMKKPQLVGLLHPEVESAEAE